MDRTAKKELFKYIDYFSAGKLVNGKSMTRETITSIKDLHAKRNYRECIHEVRRFFNLDFDLRIGYSPSKENPDYENQERIMRGIIRSGMPFLPQNFFCLANINEENRKHPTIVYLGTKTGALPMPNTPEFKKLVIKMIVQRWVFALPPGALIHTASHELCHVLLHATNNPYKQSEIATDILSMMISGPDVIGAYRKINGTRFGYLNDEQFELAYHAIKSREKTWSVQKIKSMAITAINRIS